MGHCIDPAQLTVVVVLLSSKIDFAAEHDVMILRGDHVPRDSIAQGDVVITMAKIALNRGRYQGTVQADTLLQVRLAVAGVLGIT